MPPTSRLEITCRLPPTSNDCGCCRAEPRTQPPVGDGSKVLWRFERELCQHCAAAGCQWNFAHCIRTDRVVTEKKLGAAGNVQVVGYDDGGYPIPVRRLNEPSEPDDGWRAGALRMLDGKCPWCGHPMLRLTYTEHGLRWACFEGCNP